MFELALFPLHTVLFPGMPLQLHIFEPRYRTMIQRVLQTSHTFGVSLIRNGAEANGPLAEPYLVGCTARIVRVEPLEDGRMNLTVVGDERFRVLRMGSNDPYLSAFVESIPLQSHHTLEVVRGAHVLRSRLVRYLQLLSNHTPPVEDPALGGMLSGGLAGPEDGPEGEPGPGAPESELNKLDLTRLQLPEDPMMLIYLAAALLQIPASEKQPLLEAETATLLLQHVQRMYRRELAMLPGLLKVDEEQARLSAWVN